MRILLGGLHGRMGEELTKMTRSGRYDAEIVAGVDARLEGSCEFDDIPCVEKFDYADADVDIVIDFSHHSATKDILKFTTKNRLPLVLATTGQTGEERDAVAAASKIIPIFWSANLSIGVALLESLLRQVVAAMPDAEVEIIEKHNAGKADAPSGTALLLADTVKSVKKDAKTVIGRNGYLRRARGEIGIHSVRIGNISGEHEILVGSDNQMITLKHTAYNRALFAEGALSAAKFLLGKPAGLYGMKDLIEEGRQGL